MRLLEEKQSLKPKNIHGFRSQFHKRSKKKQKKMQKRKRKFKDKNENEQKSGLG